MAEYNRNRQDAYRQQNEWDDNRRQSRKYEEEPNYTISENRGFRSGRYAGADDGGWQNRYERQGNTGREGDFDNDFSQRPSGRYREGDYGYESGSSGLSSGYADFGGNYGRENRNLYDRGYQGSTRRDYENKENRLGGANYDRYGDRGRYDEDRYSGGHGGFSSRSSYGRYDYGDDDYGRSRYGRSGQGRYDSDDYGRGNWGGRDYGRGDSDERSWWDRTTDEVSSWFGDEEAERRRARDRHMRGQHRGKGPKNYSRSDDRIKDDINDRLSDDPFIDASDIDVTVSNGEVTLTGTVDHRSSKRRAEDLAESVSGVKNVENRLRVGQQTGVHGMNTPSGTTGSQSSSPVPGSDRGRTRETSQTTK